MNYEQKYKETLELARDYYKANLRLNNADENLMLEDIFPELKESEDERIRKALIALLKFGLEDKSAIAPGYNITKEEALTWLEKQGEKPQGKSALEAINEVDVDNVNKIKSKFKVGDWVVNNATLNLCHILEVEHGQYICGDCSFPISKENEYHLWTIKDAKDRDILTVNGRPFIYCCNDDYQGNYCCIDSDGVFRTNLDFGFNGKTILPATKEQRDLILQMSKNTPLNY